MLEKTIPHIGEFIIVSKYGFRYVENQEGILLKSKRIDNLWVWG